MQLADAFADRLRVARITQLKTANPHLDAHPRTIVAQTADPIGKKIRLAHFGHATTVSLEIQIGNELH